MSIRSGYTVYLSPILKILLNREKSAKNNSLPAAQARACSVSLPTSGTSCYQEKRAQKVLNSQHLHIVPNQAQLKTTLFLIKINK